jgi:hypothetical protein
MGVLGLQGDYRVKFIDYDWRLNDAPPCSGKQGGDE